MNIKQKFGDYIVSKRKEAKLTQQELAEKLYVTKTAVSKWERGLSYPDITLIKSICNILNITAEEFVNASDDLITRKNKIQSQYYRNTAFWYHAITLVTYILAIVASLIVNLAVDHTLSWFLIVFPSILFAASLTNLPFLHRHVNDKLHLQVLIVQFVSPVLLVFLILLSTGIYSSLEWLLSAYFGILLGYSIFILPILIRKLSFINRNTKVLISLISPLIILILFLLYLSIINNGKWFLVSCLGILSVYEIFIMPYIYDVLCEFTKKWKLLLTLLLVLFTIGLLIIVAYFQYM